MHVYILFPFSYKDTSHIELEPTLMTTVYLINPLKALFPNTVTFWGLKTSRYEFGGEHNLAHNTDGKHLK